MTASWTSSLPTREVSRSAFCWEMEKETFNRRLARLFPPGIFRMILCLATSITMATWTS